MTLFLFLGLIYIFIGSLFSIHLQILELISFSATPGNRLKNRFDGSLHSKPLHGLELISFSMIPGNQCCYDDSFFLFLGLINIFMGSLYSIPLQGLEMMSFSAIPGNMGYHGNTFSASWSYKYFYGFFAFHTAARTGVDWLFANTLQQVLPRQYFFSVPWTYQ